MIKLSPCVKLPLKYIKGTEAERFAVAEKLTDDFIALAKGEFANSSAYCVIPKKLEKMIQKLLPAKIKLKLVPLKNNELYAHTSLSLKQPDMIVKKHLINIKFTQDEKIELSEVYNLSHELRHTLDYITNPKLLARKMSMFEKGYKNKLNRFIMDKFLYTQNSLSKIKFVRKSALKIASLFQSTDEQINFLQNARYTLKTERNAFKKMFEYQTKTHNACGLNIKNKSDRDILNSFDFDSKIQTINKQLKTVLKKAREAQRKSLQ